MNEQIMNINCTDLMHTKALELLIYLNIWIECKEVLRTWSSVLTVKVITLIFTR